jgi:site-specific DNA recombinase
LTKSLKQLERQQERLLEVYLGAVIERVEFERKRRELSDTQNGLHRQFRQLEAQVQKQLDVAGLASGIGDFCERIQQTLATLTFEQRRELVTLLIDRVIVDDEKVEIRYVIPTSPAGEEKLFCHLRSDYRGRPPSMEAWSLGYRQVHIHQSGSGDLPCDMCSSVIQSV